MRGWRSRLVAIALVVAAADVGAATVREEAGAIIYADDGGRETRLVSEGHDSQPVLSPDGHTVVFVREVTDGVTEIWSWRGDGDVPQRLLATRPDTLAHRNLEGFNTLLFSADGASLYFLSRAWAVSDALYVLDLASGHERFVIDANDVRLGPPTSGRRTLIVQRHRYPNRGGGAIDDYWLVTDSGKILRHIGDEAAVDRLLARKAR